MSFLVASCLLFIVGTAINVIAYGSFEPFLAAIMIYGLAGVILYVTPIGGAYERRMFLSVVPIGWFMAGIAAVYANFLNDRVQNELDAALFYELASGGASTFTREDLMVVTEGAGAVVLWRAFYDAFAYIGFDKGRYLGVLLNVVAVASSGVIAVKMARTIFGDDPERLNRLVLLFSLCGVFWLFAAIHIRDGMVLLGVTALTYVWTRYLHVPKIGNLSILVVSSGFALAYFGALRTEFQFVPVAMTFAGLLSILLCQNLYGRRVVAFKVFALFGLSLSVLLLWWLWDTLLPVVSVGHETYAEQSALQHSSGSLGLALIVNQPLLLRMLLGVPYIYVIPIPLWTGFQLESAYHLFKSLHALFAYLLIPLLLLAVWRIMRSQALRTPAVMFLPLVTIGFSMGIAGTSLESRHLGTFLVPAFILALVPNFGLRADRVAYMTILGVLLFGMAMVHIAWAMLKL